MFQKCLLTTAIAAALLTGCADSERTAAPENNNNTGGNQDGSSAQDRSLQQVDNSDAFFEALREGLLQQQPSRNDNVQAEVLASTTDGEDSGSTDGGTAGPAGGGDAAFNESAEDTATSASTDIDFTGTNVQEVGVDEQDRVKTDGQFLYVLQNNYSDYFAISGEGGGIAIDTVAVPVTLPDNADETVDGQAEPEIDILPPQTDIAVTSLPAPVKQTSTIRILALQPDAPDVEPLVDLDVSMDGRSIDGMYLYNNNDQRNLILTSTAYGNHWEYWNDSASFGGASSVITKLDVTDPSQASVKTTFQIDGEIISSRRIGNHLFVASRYYPVIRGVEPYALTPEEYEQQLDAADLTEVLPQYTSTADNTGKDLIDPKGCFVATKPDDSSYYYTPDIVTLAMIDLNTMQLTDSECYLGATETLYATPNAVYLATTRWDYGSVPVLELDDVVSTTRFEDPRVDTDIHQFTIGQSSLEYSGSGVVSGHLGWNPLRKPFRMSEKDGYLRVATFAQQQNESVSPINVSVLKVDGDGPLVKVAELPNPNRPAHIGKPGEQLYASRFLGNRAYLVTFRQTDPLYVVNFDNHEDPKLAGELEIEGYSDYLQPIGEDYLLGIGKDAVPAPDNFGDGLGALTQGVKLSLFNVSDAENPVEVQSLVVGERGTEAVALQNHRAITVQHATDERPTRVTFGIDVAGLADPRPVNDPTIWYPWNFSGLHGFEIKVGQDAGIEKRGVMVVNSASNPVQSPYAYFGDDRSVLVGDSVFYIRGSSVYSANWFGLSNFTGPR